MRRRTIFIIIGVVIILGLAAGVRILSPRLEQVTPIDGATGILPAASVELTFSGPMNTGSVVDRFSSQPIRSGSFDWLENTLIFIPDEPWPTGETVTVTLAAGAQSKLGLPLLGEQSWSFRVGSKLLAYLWPADGLSSLYALDPLSGETDLLAEEPAGIFDYTIAANGTDIFYSTYTADGTSLIRYLDRVSGQSRDIVICVDALCGQPQISPQGGGYLAYTRTPQSGTATTQIWVNYLNEGDAAQISEANHQNENPFWSPNGLLTFYDRDASTFVVFDPQIGVLVAIPSETGGMAGWLSEGSGLIFPEIEFWGEGPTDYYSNLWLVTYPAGGRRNLTGQQGVEDVSPAVSPSGMWIAYGRKFLDEERWSPGHQLWLMHTDGSDPRPLTSAGDYNHTDFAWHPDGGQLAFMRYNQSVVTAPPEIWLINIDGSGAVRLVINGYAPQWIP